MSCMKCGCEKTDYPFRVLQVQTLHVRDLGGEKKVQALGEFEEYAVCGACAQARYQQHMNNTPAMIKALLPFAVIGIVGAVLTMIFWNSNGAFRLLGLGMLAGGLLCAFGNAQKIGRKKRELSSVSYEEALSACAWEVLLENAPKKNDINDITYIPVDEKTMSRKNGDLMILYDLLPAIAVQAYNRIHGIEE